MSGLLSKQSQARETEHIYESVSDRLLTLRKRLVRWASIAVASGVVSLGLIGGGLTLLLLGQMPDSLTLVEPSVTSSSQLIESADYTALGANDAIGTLIGILDGPVTKILALIVMLFGLMQAVLRMDIARFVAGIFGSMAIFSAPQVMLSILGEAGTYESTPYSQIRPQFETATESSNWPEAWELLKPIPDTDEVVVLKAQVAYKAGLEPESVRLIQSIQPGTELSGQAWFIESAYAESHEGAGYQITNASQKYAENQTSRSSLGASMLKGSVPFGVLAFLTGCVAFVIRRNAISIQSWLKQSKTKAELNEIVANDKATMELVQTEECN